MHSSYGPLCRSPVDILQGANLVMGSEDALGLAFDDRLYIGRKTDTQRILVVISGVVLSILDGFKNAGVIASQPVPEIYPNAVQFTGHAGTAVGIRLAEVPRDALQLSRKSTSLQCLAGKESPQLGIPGVFSGFQKACLPVAAGLDQLFNHRDRVNFHFSTHPMSLANPQIWLDDASAPGFAGLAHKSCD